MRSGICEIFVIFTTFSTRLTLLSAQPTLYRADEKDRLTSDPIVQQEVALSRMRYLSKLLAAYRNIEGFSGSANGSSSSSAYQAKKRRRTATEENIGRVKAEVSTSAANECSSSSNSDLQTGNEMHPNLESGRKASPILQANDMELTEATELSGSAAEQKEKTSKMECSEQETVTQVLLTAAAVVTAPSTPGISSGNLVASSSGNTTAKSSKSGIDLFPEIKTITCHEAAATLWGLVVGELETIHRQHLKKDVLHDIFIIAEKHAFFQHLLIMHPMEEPVHGSGLEAVKTEGDYNNESIRAKTTITAEASDIAWAQMNRIAYANKIFRYLDLSVQGTSGDRLAGWSKRHSIG